MEISLGQKPLFWGQKQGFLGQKQGFLNIPNLRNIQNFFYSELSKNYEKMTLKLNFENCKKLIPTRIPTRTFQFKFGMQGLIIHKYFAALDTVVLETEHGRTANTEFLTCFFCEKYSFEIDDDEAKVKMSL